ncbi:MAG: phage tail assembly chaperone [Alphaproteobacteria bacterium]
MFKAIKDNKVIAVSDKADFPLLNFDSVVEDAEHTADDYVHVDGQFVLKTDDAAKEQKAAAARAERDRRIDAARWRIERYQTQLAAGLETTDTAKQYKALLLYVQALRDVPDQDGFPDNVVWPEVEDE